MKGEHRKEREKKKQKREWKQQIETDGRTERNETKLKRMEEQKGTVILTKWTDIKRTDKFV